MNVAFDQVTSKKDQEQYWIQNEKPYHYVSVPEFNAYCRVFLSLLISHYFYHFSFNKNFLSYFILFYVEV
jgi:hypothetical protein